jgi:hypothetical protein
VWTEPIIDTLKLIEWMMSHEVCGFNLAFDHFHLCKLYTVLSNYTDAHALPEDIIEELAEIEPSGRDGQCLKPKAACDVMLHARKGPYQSTMERRDIRIRKIPSRIAEDVCKILEGSIQLDDIYFARRKDKHAPRWQIFERDDGDEFVDVVLKFKASSALKNLAIHALKLPVTEVLRFGDISLPKNYNPIEVGYAPFALALSTPEKHWKAKIKKGSGWQRGFCWPALINYHISHWTHNNLARQYAEDDVKYTREVWKHLGSPEAGDDDSELACQIGASRWKGYKIDIEGLKQLRTEAIKKSQSAPKAPTAAKPYLLEVMDEIEGLEVEKTTEKLVLEKIATWENDDGTKHKAALRAQEILDARMAKWEADLYTKLIQAERFHASFKTIGALSGRMSGADSLNPQGIKRSKHIRRKFPLADPDMVLCGGDFDAFEVVLTIAYYGDEKLAEAVKSGKKVHALFGMHLFPGMTYEGILEDIERYTRSKNGVFALIYFGNAYTLTKRVGIDMESAEKAYQSFITDYPGIGQGRKKIIDMFCSMKQEGGVGTAVKWNEPAEHIESMFGYPRYFTLENQICKILFKIAQKPPKRWREYKGKVMRRDRDQTLSGAAQSALYAAAFAIQGSNTRAAGNHVIQSSGAQITKKVQRKIWDLQPVGVNAWCVQPMNIHDEIMCPTKETHTEAVKQIVDETVESFRDKVPLIKMEWGTQLESWADK